MSNRTRHVLDLTAPEHASLRRAIAAIDAKRAAIRAQQEAEARAVSQRIADARRLAGVSNA